jgi:hypothetical protein
LITAPEDAQQAEFLREQSITTHSTGARIECLSSFFSAMGVECFMPRPVNSGVGRLSFIQSIEKELSQIYDWRCFTV